MYAAEEGVRHRARYYSKRRIVSSISSLCAAANEISVPMILKPDFRRTCSEPALSLAARACSGRVGTKSPGRAFDPVCDFGLPLEDEAADAAYEPAVAGHCPQRRIGRASGPGERMAPWLVQ
jgi:hypothetical protein